MRATDRLTWLCLSVVLGGGAILGCGNEDKADSEPLLVPWSQLTGRIAYVRGSREIMVIDSTRRVVERVYLAEADADVRDVTWHPNGALVTATLFHLGPGFAAFWSLASIDVRTGAKTDLYPTMSDPVFADWSPDGRIAFKSGGPPAFGGLYIDGELVPTDVVIPVALSAPSWSPDGSTLAVIQDNTSGWHGYGDLRLLDVASGTATSLGPSGCAHPRYSPDGTLIAFTRVSEATSTDRLWLASVPGGVETHLSGADSIMPTHPDWSPDGSRLVVHSEAQPNLYLVDATTGAPVQLTAKGGHLPAWIP